MMFGFTVGSKSTDADYRSAVFRSGITARAMVTIAPEAAF
jgi:hypothetical protein